jgi:thiamine pyrophosphate-dependent acetolactate synthase large subunit-like protein
MDHHAPDPTRPNHHIDDFEWVRVDPDPLEPGGVTTVVAGERVIAITRTDTGFGALDDRCPHQRERFDDGQPDASPDFAADVESCGAFGARASTVSELREALITALVVDGPALVEVAVSSFDV